jgi:hypothetical protein
LSNSSGVYDTDSSQTLYLFVDVKTSGDDTWPVVLQALSPLKSANYLTTTDGEAISPGPVTVIGTGNIPLSYFQPNDPASTSNPRFAFYDGPLATLNQTNITNLIRPITSTDFAAVFGNVMAEGLNSTQTAILQAQLAVANQRGILARYWDQPGWPIGTRNAIWRILWEASVGLLNVDDLIGAAGFWESKG